MSRFINEKKKNPNVLSSSTASVSFGNFKQKLDLICGFSTLLDMLPESTYKNVSTQLFYGSTSEAMHKIEKSIFRVDNFLQKFNAPRRWLSVLLFKKLDPKTKTFEYFVFLNPMSDILFSLLHTSVTKFFLPEWFLDFNRKLSQMVSNSGPVFYGFKFFFKEIILSCEYKTSNSKSYWEDISLISYISAQANRLQSIDAFILRCLKSARTLVREHFGYFYSSIHDSYWYLLGRECFLTAQNERLNYESRNGISNSRKDQLIMFESILNNLSEKFWKTILKEFTMPGIEFLQHKLNEAWFTINMVHKYFPISALTDKKKINHELFKAWFSFPLITNIDVPSCLNLPEDFNLIWDKSYFSLKGSWAYRISSQPRTKLNRLLVEPALKNYWLSALKSNSKFTSPEFFWFRNVF